MHFKRFLAFLLVIAASGVSSAKDSVVATKVRSLNNRLLEIHMQAQSETGKQSEWLQRQARAVIKERAAALALLAGQDAKQAMSLVFSPDVLQSLAQDFPDSAALLEVHGTWEGRFEHWIVDADDLKSHRSIRRINSGHQLLDVNFAGNEPEGLKGGDTVVADGVLIGGTLAVASAGKVSGASTAVPDAISSAATLTTNTAAATCSTTGGQNVAALLVTFPGLSVPATAQAVRDVFFGTSSGHSLDGFWREASDGKTSASGDVFGWYTLTGAYSCANLPQVMNDAIAAASASGVNLQSYSRIFLVLPSLSCGWAGMTPMGCNTLNTPNGAINASTSYVLSSFFSTRDDAVSLVAHEGGHQLGLSHAGTITGGTEVLGPLTSPGTEGEYGDFMSTMGARTLSLYGAGHKAMLNWMAPNTNYQVVQSSGTYTLQPLEASPAGLKALKIERGTGNNQWLWVEYRQPIGNYDSTVGFMSQAFTGALIHYEDPAATAHTYVLDFTPGDTYWYSPALAAGQTWADPYSNLSITVQSATASGLTVGINYGTAPCTHANPTVSISPANPSAYANSSVSYAISVTNNDAAGCSASTFNLSSSQPGSWGTAYSASYLTLNPGQTGSLTMTKTVPPGTAAATYAVDANAASGTFASSGSANCTVTSAPTPAVTLSVSSPSYTLRQTVSSTASVVYGSTPAAGASVTFTMTDPNGHSVVKTLTADQSGKASWAYKLGPKDVKGIYSCSARVVNNSQSATSNTVQFTVQ